MFHKLETNWSRFQFGYWIRIHKADQDEEPENNLKNIIFKSRTFFEVCRSRKKYRKLLIQAELFLGSGFRNRPEGEIEWSGSEDNEYEFAGVPHRWEPGFERPDCHRPPEPPGGRPAPSPKSKTIYIIYRDNNLKNYANGNSNLLRNDWRTCRSVLNSLW